MNDLRCPYCDEFIDPLLVRDAEYVEHRHRCDVCSNTFIYKVDYTPVYTSRQAACLNGAPHQLNKCTGDSSEASYMYAGVSKCSVCNIYATDKEERLRILHKERDIHPQGSWDFMVIERLIRSTEILHE